jgi:FMN reductase
METSSPRILAVVASLSASSATRTVLLDLGERLRRLACAVDVLDLQQEQLALFNPESAYGAPGYGPLKTRVETADVLLLGTPDYHGSMSGAMKNFLDHFWHEFAGKLFVPLVASHEKGLTVMDQLRTVARQSYAWALPYGIAFTEKLDVRDGRIVSTPLEQRLAMSARDIAVYGALLARQRRLDLTGSDPGFLARYRG